MQNTQVMDENEVQEEDVNLVSTSQVRSFIDRYHLGGNVKHVSWEIRDHELYCDFVTSDQSLVGNVTMTNFPMDNNEEVGIYDTSSLDKLLRIMDEEIDLSVNHAGGKAIELIMSDDFKEVNFRLGELEIIPETPEIKHVPDFNVVLDPNENFVSNFTSADKALKDSSTFAVQSDGDNLNITIGYSEMGNTNSVNLTPSPETEIDRFEEMEPTMFSSELFSEILSANSDANDIVWEVSEEGLTRITFESELYHSEYYLVAKTEGV